MSYGKQENLNLQQILAGLELEHSTLRFPEFTCKSALDIGSFLVEKAKSGQKPITIDITAGQQQLFHCALEGTTYDNDQWVIRKNRVVNKFKKSSYYISILLMSQNKSIEEAYGLSSVEYAPFGGSYPILTESDSFIGTITVSGLPDHEDHEMVVDAIKWHLDHFR